MHKYHPDRHRVVPEGAKAAVDPARCVSLATGQHFDLLHARPTDFTLDAIAAGLAKTPRFAGQNNDAPISIAQHCCFAETLVPFDADPAARLAVLLHDAHEAVLGDWITPVKCALRAIDPAAGVALKRLETFIAGVIHAGFGLPYPYADNVSPAIVKMCDRVAFVTEWAVFMSHMPPAADLKASWRDIKPQPHLMPQDFKTPWHWEAAGERWRRQIILAARDAGVTGPIIESSPMAPITK